MEIKNHVEGTTCIVSPRGQLDALTGPTLNQHFQEKLNDYKHLVLDLSAIDFVSSAGLRVLLGTVKEARRLSGDLRLAAVNPDVKKVLSVSGFDRLLKIFDDVQTAILSYAE